MSELVYTTLHLLIIRIHSSVSVHGVITDLISMYTLSVLIKALMFFNSSSLCWQSLIG